MKGKKILVDKKVIGDLIEKLDDVLIILESISFSNNPKLIKSLKKSKEQIRKCKLC